MKVRIDHSEEFEIDQDAQGNLIEPKCPKCGVGALRPKCFWELGAACPRHDLVDAYRIAERRQQRERSE